MAGNWVNFLYFDDGIFTHEVINGARTLEYLRNSPEACSVFDVRSRDCEILYLDPCDYTPVTFTTPDDPTNPAPWWDGVADSPTSRAYGFLIDEWTGLDGAHMTRDATPVRRKGSVFGALGQAHRVWKMNLSLFAADQVALEALFRWLEDMLIQCCSPGVTAWVRTVCPTGYDDDEGLVHVVDLQMLEGLQWEGASVEGLACKTRQVSFTLGVGDPCLYKPPTTCYDDEVFQSHSYIVDVAAANSAAASSNSTTFDDPVNLTVVWAGALDDYTLGVSQYLVSHGNPASAVGGGFHMLLDGTGHLALYWTTNGSSFTGAASADSVADFVANGETIWLKAKTFIIERDGLTGTQVDYTRYYWSLDGADWEMFYEASVASLIPLPMEMASAAVYVGGRAIEGTAGEHVYAAALRGDVGDDPELDGRLMFQFNANDSGGASPWTDPRAGHTWTIGASFVTIEAAELDAPGQGLSKLLGCDDNAFAQWRRCCAVEGVPLGAVAPVIILRNLHPDRDSGPFRVRGVLQTGDCDMLHEANLDFGEVRISYIPPQSQVMIDCARERILWRPEGGEHRWEPGYAYLDQDANSVPSYPAVGCQDGMIYVEPAAITPVLDDVLLTVFLVGRYGCC